MFTLTTDPILGLADCKALLELSTDQQAILLINGLSEKFKRFTNRVQINQNTTTAIVEKIIPYGGSVLHLHAPIYTTVVAITAEIVVGDQVEQTYTYADGELNYVTNDHASRIILEGCWPDDTLAGFVRVTYKGGWATIPADVVQGAIMQGRVDLARMKGEVGMNSRGAQGESTQYQTAGLVRECLDLWAPYRVLI